ncbi:GlxA family transcriptional regulator [Mycobacterium saskatchewanense]|uniref:GlxA family transcriptional regulator n=1 Tax=Mycobacterium saskatchewanense TaxID=220927 RepID=UPI0018D8AE85|nr:helix-turn-helix domain-containing protein [Mycobacterium saskatchewanense]
MPMCSPTPGSAAHEVAVVAMPGVLSFELGIAIHVFDFDAYAVTVCGEGTVQDGQSRVAISPPAGLEAIAEADTVIVPGSFPAAARPSPALISALQEAHGNGARIASICLGSFALGYAGLLDHRQSTTHWLHLDTLAQRFPGTEVCRDVLYVRDGSVCTSAGVASGIDLCLDMIRSDLGAAEANQRGRILVAAPHRSGDQRQFVQHFVPPVRGDSMSSTRDWLLAHLHAPLTLEDIARHANMSTRNFSRRFFAETGVSPMKWLQTARIDHARELLESTDLTVEQVARRSGLGTVANFRRIFTRQVSVLPRDYRQLYRPLLAAAGE